MNKEGKMENISEGDEQLLMKFVDGECSAWERMKAKRLLNRSPIAQEFVHQCRESSRHFSDVMADVMAFGTLDGMSKSRSQVDLWERIEGRIDQEERAAFFLGERRFPEAGRQRESSSAFQFLSEFFQPNLLGSGAGVAIAACLAVLIWQPGIFQLMNSSPQDSPSQNSLLQNNPLQASPEHSAQLGSKEISPVSGTASSVANVNLVSKTQARPNPLSLSRSVRTRGAAATQESGYVQPQILDNEWNRTVEVDWMRSDGRVRMVHEPSSGVPIIWVKRRNLNSTSRRSLRSVSSPAPVSRGLNGSPVPTARLAPNR